ncbi:hypothetical protein [Larkinella humicola]|uniref:Uncharacterized protein n=1 Tax=Larkinella humicola TaxID=2607654 RepID=A0A5N1JDC0_9BACT|nr:hypothetical protein [Larkinella humicola]KAA9352950.1 hypothetical protein F0P93_17355 [Larkinella humicola]
MRISFYLLAAMGLFCSQCTQQYTATPKPVTPKIDYDQVSIQLMQNLAPEIIGTWTLQKVVVKHNPRRYFREHVKLTKDSTFLNLATLTIRPAAVARSTPRDIRRGEYDGTIEYGGKAYPVQLNLRADFGWLVNREGPQAISLFEYHFPNGTRIVEPEEAFLKDLGLINDNFSIEVINGQRKMVWRGFDRGVEQVDLVKQ